MKSGFLLLENYFKNFYSQIDLRSCMFVFFHTFSYFRNTLNFYNIDSPRHTKNEIVVYFHYEIIFKN